MEHKGNGIFQMHSRKWELGRHGAHAFVHTWKCVHLSLLMALASCMHTCGHKEYSVFISHRLGEGSHVGARYKALVGHLHVTYIGHGLLFAKVWFLIWRKNKLTWRKNWEPTTCPIPSENIFFLFCVIRCPGPLFFSSQKNASSINYFSSIQKTQFGAEKMTSVDPECL